MKKVILSVLLLGIIMGLQAQELKVINLNKPDKSRNVTLMQALDKRHSERAFANKQLTHQDLSDLIPSNLALSISVKSFLVNE